MKNKFAVSAAVMAVTQTLAEIAVSASGSVPAPDTGNVSPTAYAVPAVLLAVTVIAGKKGKKK